MTNPPPRFAEWLMKASLPPGDRPAILGDLFEGFVERQDWLGLAHARRWYWRQTITSLGPNLVRRVRVLNPLQRFQLFLIPLLLATYPRVAGWPMTLLLVDGSLNPFVQPSPPTLLRNHRGLRRFLLEARQLIQIGAAVTVLVTSVNASVVFGGQPHPYIEWSAILTHLILKHWWTWPLELSPRELVANRDASSQPKT